MSLQIPQPFKLLSVFYMMKWSVLKPNAENITTLDAAYLWYHANSSVSLQSLFQDMVYLATIDAKADVITALMLCDDSEALIANKFEKGTRTIEYYSYNFAVPNIEASEVSYYFV